MARRAERTLGNISRGDPPIASLARLHSSKMTLGAAVEAFLADRDLASATRRAYRATYGSLLQAFGPEMPVTALTPVQLQRWLTRRWGKAAPATWNARLAASRVLVGYCQRQGWLERDPTRSLERRRTPRDETRAIPLEALDALWSRTDIGLREKALWRMLYATAARASDDPVQAGAQSPPILWVTRAGFSSPRQLVRKLGKDWISLQKKTDC